MQLRACQKVQIVLSQNMTQATEHWISKSAVARAEDISRRTVQRTCQLWEQLPGKKEYQVTDENGRVNLEGFRLWSSSIKKLERRGFPRGKKRQPSVLSVRPQRKTFGRSYVQRVAVILAEIDAMTDGQQVALLVSWLQGHAPEMFSPDVAEKAIEIVRLSRHKRDDLARVLW
jgi:hypothetical protein